MMIRRAAIQDLEQIMQIYARAVQYMHASGNPNQWVAGYPSRTLIEEDIARGVSYVVDRDSVFLYRRGGSDLPADWAGNVAHEWKLWNRAPAGIRRTAPRRGGNLLFLVCRAGKNAWLQQS